MCVCVRERDRQDRLKGDGVIQRERDIDFRRFMKIKQEKYIKEI